MVGYYWLTQLQDFIGKSANFSATSKTFGPRSARASILVAKCEIHHVKWALPLIEEFRQQIEPLMDKTKVDMDDARAVKTMTGRLTALIGDVGELVEFCAAVKCFTTS